MGNLFGQDYFSFEQKEANLVYKASVDQLGNSIRSNIVTASVVIFSGWEFMCTYLINAFLAYSKYVLPEESPSEDELNQDVTISGEYPEERFTVRQGGKIHFLDYRDIEYVEASGNYIQVVSNNKKYTVRVSLNEWLKVSKKEYFVRIHRSFAINTHFIKELTSIQDGQHAVVLQSGQQVKVGKQFKAAFFANLKVGWY